MSTRILFTAADQRAVLLATLQHSKNRAPDYFRRTQERYKRDSNQPLRKHREKARAGG